MLNKEEQNQEKEPIKDMNEHTASNEPEDQALQEELDTVEDGKKEGGAGEKVEEPVELTLQESMEKLQTQYNDLQDKYLRLFAEFDNYKKRTVKERIELMKTAAQDTMTALLPVLDDFDRAKKNSVENNTEQLFNEGIGLVHQKLIAVLSQKGLKAMESTGEAFDAELHEAFAEIPAPSDEMKGKVVDTIEKGYLLKDKIIRHARVVVGK